MSKMKRKSIDEVALKRKISINEWIQYFVVLNRNDASDVFFDKTGNLNNK